MFQKISYCGINTKSCGVGLKQIALFFFTIFILHAFYRSLLTQFILTGFYIIEFTITGVVEDPDTFHIHLEEINNLQSELTSPKVHSKGFFPEITVQDFPIRGHNVFYHIKRRRWIDTQSNEVIYRNWTLVEKGTRMTGEFAAFKRNQSIQP
ncbi:hypothetical protein SAMN05421827_12262 [Pedobacter terrae]|uniref:Transposase n=1 Tax=Pedobacter terrae TaxID=405671 RepID=A0A1G8BUX3_9SPHI|nr:hypothetical protein [Pedobacter terrae]SDH36869.1 hypothetical protein SAMN05421827_12262 [Pedobacter terrae]